MGSSIGNFMRNEVPKFLEGFASVLRPGDTLLVGIDACKDPEKVYHAYNDREGTTHRFLKNGLDNANRLLGSKQFDLNHWSGNGEYDIAAGRHHAFVTPDVDVSIDGVLIRKDERVWIEESNKWSSDETARLWDAAGLREGAKWCNSTGDYGKPQPEFTRDNAMPHLYYRLILARYLICLFATIIFRSYQPRLLIFEQHSTWHTSRASTTRSARSNTLHSLCQA